MNLRMPTRNPYPHRETPVLKKSAADLDKLYAQQAIPLDLYEKLLVGLAFEFSENHESEYAFRLLMKVRPDYYKNQLPIDADEDEFFREDVIKLVQNLDLAGILPSADMDFALPENGVSA